MVSCLAESTDCAAAKNAGNSRSSSAMRRGIGKINDEAPTRRDAKCTLATPLPPCAVEGGAGLFATFVANKRPHPFRPLGHPTFSTGSPRLFHWVTQGFSLGHPRVSGSKSTKKANAADGNLPLRLLLKHLSKEKANLSRRFWGR